MATPSELSPVHDQVSVSDPESFAISDATAPTSQQSAFIPPPQTIYNRNESDYPMSPIPTLPDNPPPQLLHSLALGPNMTATDSEVEVDAEVWTARTSQDDDDNTFGYNIIQVPSSGGNVLIASSTDVTQGGIYVPDSHDHLWHKLTSETHTVKSIPPIFQKWMGPIQNFLEKSAVYFRPYADSAKRRGTTIQFLIVSIFLWIPLCLVFYESIYLWHMLAYYFAYPVAYVALCRSMHETLANGVKALKLCGKYEKSLLPPNIKVILGPYGAYWKFVRLN